MSESVEPQYDVALSFAAEDRPYVQKVALKLRDCGIKFFYDDYEQVALWGKDLYTHLDSIYRSKSRFCVLFISEHYARRVWTNHERRSAQARAIRENQEYILPARFDETPIDGLPETIGYLDISQMPPKKLARLIKEKVGPRYSNPGFPKKADRLWESMGMKGAPKAQKIRVQKTAHSFYEALGLMNPDERRVVAGIFAFGCAVELPAGVHISMDLLSRMIKMDKESIEQHLKRVRSLNLRTKIREGVSEPEHGELAADDKDIRVNFWSASTPWSNDSTEIAMKTVLCAADHFCAEHGLEVVTRLDFSRLSKNSVGLAARTD